jgi:YggT family protein
MIFVIINALISWFPNARGTQVDRIVSQVVDPLIQPIRRIMPRTGMIDLSGMILIVLLLVMIEVVRRAAEQ